ncbi:MAG: trigger factor [Anaerolineales bacterium]|nr:trigger factor [Anaerolineales bacterium]
MKIEQNELENRQVELTIEVPEEMVTAAMKKTARKLSSQVKVPGFRPGKAPYDILLHRLGEDTVFEEALESLGQEVYSKALEEADINPSSIGSFNDIVSREPLVLKYTVPLQPIVELGSYEDIRIDFTDPEINEEREQEVLTMLQQSRAVIEPVERPAQLSDLVVVDVHGELLPKEGIDETEEDRHLAEEHGITLLVSEEGNYPFKGIYEHLIGLESELEKEIEYTFPGDYEDEQLRNRTAMFTIKCLDVKSRELPELTDELVSELGDFENLEDMKGKIRADILETEKRQALEEYNRELISKIVEGAEIDYPPILLEEEIDEMLQEVDQNLRQRKFSLAEQLKLENKTIQDFRKDIEPDAEFRLKRSLVLGKALDLQKIRVENDEIEAEISNLRAQFPQSNAEIEKLLNHPVQRQRILMDLLTRKTIDRLSLIARDKYSPEEETKELEGTSAAEKKPTPKKKAPAKKKSVKETKTAEEETKEQKTTAAAEKIPAPKKKAPAKKKSVKETKTTEEKNTDKEESVKPAEEASSDPGEDRIEEDKSSDEAS